MKKLKINIYQTDVSRIGGSIATTLTFADLFKEMGHEVKILSAWHERFRRSLIGLKEDLISFYNFKYLTLEDFDFSWTWDRIKNAPRSQRPDADIDFTRGFSSSKHMQNKGIVWSIVPAEISKISHPDVKQVWTNSKTSRERLRTLNPKIVYPPHDYSMFREYSKPWNEREYSFVSILRANEWHAKGIDVYHLIQRKTVKSLKSILITTINSDSLGNTVNALGVDYCASISREECAMILGNSKVLFHPSREESCPLVVYEALNAGCVPVSRDVGAVREQVGSLGVIWEKDFEALDAIRAGLKHPSSIKERIRRGLHFDRVNVKQQIQNCLEEV